MSSINQSSPPNKRLRSKFLKKATAREPTTSAAMSRHIRATSVEGHNASRAIASNKKLSEVVISLRRTIKAQNAHIARLERDQGIQLGVIDSRGGGGGQ